MSVIWGWRLVWEIIISEYSIQLWINNKTGERRERTIRWH